MTTPTSGVTGSGTPESQWTHVKLFNKVKDGVSGLFGEGKIASKIGGFFGWSVAIITSPATLLGGLVYDGGQKIKSLFSRDAKKVESVEKKVPTQAQFEALQKKLSAAEDEVKKAKLENANLNNHAESQIDALTKMEHEAREAHQRDRNSKVGFIRKQQREIAALNGEMKDQQAKLNEANAAYNREVDAKLALFKKHGELLALKAELKEQARDIDRLCNALGANIHENAQLSVDLMDAKQAAEELEEEADKLRDLWHQERDKTWQDKLNEETARLDERMAKFEERMAQIRREGLESDSLPVATDSQPVRSRLHLTLRQRDIGTGHRFEDLPVRHGSALPGMNGPDVDAELYSSRVQADSRSSRMENLRQRVDDALSEASPSEFGDVEDDDRLSVVSDQFSTIIDMTARDRAGSPFMEDESMPRRPISPISRQAGRRDSLDSFDCERVEVTHSDLEDSEFEVLSPRPLTRHISGLADRRRESISSESSWSDVGGRVVASASEGEEGSEVESPRKQPAVHTHYVNRLAGHGQPTVGTVPVVSPTISPESQDWTVVDRNGGVPGTKV